MNAIEPITSEAQHLASGRNRLPVAVLLSVAAHLLLGIALGTLWLRVDQPSQAVISVSVRIANVAASSGEKSRPPQPEQKPRPQSQRAQPKPLPTTPKPARPSPPSRPKPAPARPKRAVPPVVTSRAAPAPSPSVEQTTPKKTQPPERQSTETPSAPSPAPSPAGGRQAEAAIADYRAAVRNGIEQHKRYPRREQRRRHQGRSVVAFTIASDGSIDALRVVESSGFPSLDDAALTAVRKIDGHFPIPAETGREQWRFSVPIVFRLR